jgi:TonB family protein
VAEELKSSRLGLGILAGIGLVAVGSIGLFLMWAAGRQEDAPQQVVGRPRQVERPRRVDGERLPAFGEYVYIEKLPEVIRKVPPSYPDEARNAGIQGLVVIQALIGRDGKVKDTRIVTSIPELDQAAESAVRQWVFTPALAYEKPVAVWVAVPVKFALR